MRALATQIAVTQGVLKLKRVVLRYGNGKRFTEEPNRTLQPAGQGLVVDERTPEHGALVVTVIELHYEPLTAPVTLKILARPESGTRQMAPQGGEAAYREVEVFFGTSRAFRRLRMS